MRKREVRIVAPSKNGEQEPSVSSVADTAAQKHKEMHQLVLVPRKNSVSHMSKETPMHLHWQRRPSLISKEQRDALTVSAFGFGTTRQGRLDRSAASLEGGGEIGEREACNVVVSQSEKTSLRFHLCVDALSEGYISTFIHLFHLSHRDPVCVDLLSQTLFKISDDRLRWVKDQLSAVEALRRQSEFHEVSERCQLLADYFENERDYEEAAWHYDVSLRYAMESLDRPLEQAVRAAYAAFFERRKQLRKALALYDMMNKVAVAIDDDKMAFEASCHLMRIYQALGEETRLTNPAEAKRFFERAIALAQRVGSGKDEAAGYNVLGITCEQMGNLQLALQHQRAFYDVSRREHLIESEQKAALIVSSLQERLNMSSEAMKTLQNALALSEKIGDLEGVCHATMQLGQACKSNGDEEAALKYFRANFQAACRQQNGDLEDQARIALGFALGEHYFVHAGGGRGYVPIICDDVKAQLEWMSKGVL